MTVIELAEEQAGEGNALHSVHHEQLDVLRVAQARIAGLMTLLRACPPGQALTAGQMAALLAPLEDELGQALHNQQLMLASAADDS